MGIRQANKNTAGQSSPESHDITFGVELEFLAFTPEDAQLSWQYVHECLTKKVSLPCKKPGCQQGKHDFYLPVKPHAQDQLPTGERLNKDGAGYYGAWNVGQDSSVMLKGNEKEIPLRNQSIGNMELASRVLCFDRASPCPYGQTYPCTGEVLEWRWQEEINAILDTLHVNFSRPGYRLYVNRSTGLHVHVGYGNLGLPIPVVRGMAGTFVALERCFDFILPTSRISGYEAQVPPLPSLDTHGLEYRYDCSGTFGPGEFCNFYCCSMSKIMIDHQVGGIRQELYKSGSEPNMSNTSYGFEGHALEEPDDQIAAVDEWPTVCNPSEQPKTFEEAWDVPIPDVQGGWEQGGWGSGDWEQEMIIYLQQQPQQQFQPNDCSGNQHAIGPFNPVTSAMKMRGYLSSLNIPAWLHLIRSRSTLEDLQVIGMSSKNQWLNLTNMFFADGKPTAEVRMHAGSLCFGEISAWIDFLCTLTRWTEAKSTEDMFGLLERAWEDPEFNFVSLCKVIGASDNTVAHYASVLDPASDYAQNRFMAATSPAQNPSDDLARLTQCIERNRFREFSRLAVSEKIRHKLEMGRYGQFPFSFLRTIISETELRTDRGRLLDIDADPEDYIQFVDQWHRDKYSGVPLIPEASGKTANSPAADTNAEDSNEKHSNDGYFGLHPSIHNAMVNTTGSNLVAINGQVCMADPPRSPTQSLDEDWQEQDDLGYFGLHPSLYNAMVRGTGDRPVSVIPINGAFRLIDPSEDE